MKQEVLKKQFEKEHNDLQMIRYQVIEAQTRFEKAEDAAGCLTCVINKNDLKNNFYNRFQSCRFDLRCKKVQKLFKEFAVLKKKEETLREEYASKVFEYLSDSKPNLLNREEKKIVPWEEVFQGDFKSFEPALLTALVALVENVGGRYRIVES